MQNRGLALLSHAAGGGETPRAGKEHAGRARARLCSAGGRWPNGRRRWPWEPERESLGTTDGGVGQEEVESVLAGDRIAA